MVGVLCPAPECGMGLLPYDPQDQGCSAGGDWRVWGE